MGYVGLAKDHKCQPYTKGAPDPHGCHAASESGRNLLLCWNCFGEGCPDCTEGYQTLDRCHNYNRTQAMRVVGSVWKSYRWLSEKSILPIGSSYLEQSAYFVNCVSFVDAYCNALRERKQKNTDKINEVISGKAKAVTNGNRKR